MEKDIRKFLKEFSLEELLERRIFLSRTSPALQGVNVEPLIELMREWEITSLTAGDRDWHLTSEGEFSNPGARELRQGNYRSLGRRGDVFWGQNTHINPHSTRFAGADLPCPVGDVDDLEYEDDTSQADGTAAINGVAFRLERDLQRELRNNISQLSGALTITDGGTEKSVTVGRSIGRIDITAEDADGNIVVIELKVGTASPGALTQLMAYMAALENPEGKPVVGILVANDFHPWVVQAAQNLPAISLKAYSLQFSFQDR